MDIIVPEWARHRNGLSTKYAGPVAWVVLHGLYNSLCEGGHLNQHKNRQLLLDLLQAFGRAFPCIHCRRSIPGFVKELRVAFLQPAPDRRRNLMRDLHNSVNKKLYDKGDMTRTPNYGVIINHRVEDIGWDVYAKHFLLYCAARIHNSDQVGADEMPEGDRRPDLVALLDRLNECMLILNHQRVQMPSSDDDLCFPRNSTHPGKCAQMMRNLVAAFSAPPT